MHPVPRLADGRNPKISSKFRSSSRPDHQGVDIMFPRVAADGGPVGASALPTLSARHYMPRGWPALSFGPGVVSTSKEIGTGGYVIVDHPAGWRSQYMHLFNRRVKQGDQVSAGDVLGDIGYHVGGHQLLHLHFQLRKNGELVDPGPVLKNVPVLDRPASALLFKLAVLGFMAWGAYRLLN